VMKYGDAPLMRAFAMNVPNSDKDSLENFARTYEAIFGFQE